MKTKISYLFLVTFAFCGLLGCVSQPCECEWGKCKKILCRATAYSKGKHASDPWSKMDQSASGVSLRYASINQIGVASVPSGIQRWSLIELDRPTGPLIYVAADRGTDVESGKAAIKSGKTSAEKKAPVIDFCAPKQSWRDFLQVKIYPYLGNQSPPEKEIFNRTFIGSIIGK